MTSAILTETIEVPIGGGRTMGAHVARPRDGAAAAVIVAGELFGISAHVREVCELLAGAGYLALAPDLNHRTAPWVELPEDEDGRRRGFQLLDQMTRAQVLADLGAASSWLRTHGYERLAMLGLSVGGHIVYLAAASLDVAATVVLYAGWLTSAGIPLSRPQPTLTLTAKICAPLLYLVGDQDHLVTAEDRAEIAATLRGSREAHELVVYPGVGHGFLSGRRASHDPEAERDAWRRILNFYRVHMG